jgi:uncharacterized membrane protein
VPVPLDQDLWTVLLTTGAAGALVAAPGGPARVAAALLLASFLPGYALLAALYPGRADLSALERVTLSVVASFALVIVVGLALSATPWGLGLVPVALSLVAVILGGTAAASLRRRRLAVGERIAPAPRMVYVVVAACLLLGAAGAGFGVAALGAREFPPTQFYLLGPSGTLAGYPTRATVGRPMGITVGIANREPRAETYRLVVSDGTSVLAAYEIAAGARSSVERQVAFTPARPGRIDVTFLLYKHGEPLARQFLRLPLTVAP